MECEEQDLFNWYINTEDNETFINGDICIVKFRHEDFIKEKHNEKTSLYICKMDQVYGRKTRMLKERSMLFIKMKILKITKDKSVITKKHRFRLINMDSFFNSKIDRQTKQLEFIRI